MSGDNARVFPVDILVIHHSTGPEFVNSTDREVCDWYDSVGRTRGYAGVAHSNHYDPETGKETFAQAQFSLHQYDVDNNKYGYRLTPMILDPFNNVAWHAGIWAINQRSIGIETCGLFTNKKLPDKALMLIADTFREHDKQLVEQGVTGGMSVFGHKDFSPTACPGQIYDQIGIIIDMMNNPDAWNATLWPSQQPIEPIVDWKDGLTPLDPPQTFKVIEPGMQLVDFVTGQVLVSDYPLGTRLTLHGKTEIINGSSWYMTHFAIESDLSRGFREEDLYKNYAMLIDGGIEPVPEPEPTPQPILMLTDPEIRFIKALYSGAKVALEDT